MSSCRGPLIYRNLNLTQSFLDFFELYGPLGGTRVQDSSPSCTSVHNE